MIGVLGDSERSKQSKLLSASPPSRFTHKEEGFAVSVAPPRPGEDEDLQWNGVATDSHAVLAFEGYVYACDTTGDSAPAKWLLQQYRQKGLAAFSNLHGAYAFCLFDREARKAWMGACAFGRRDLYYMRENRTTFFSTDLAQLLELPARRPGLATDQLPNTFLAGAVYGGDTLVAGVRRALPGAMVASTGPSLEEHPPAPLPEFTGAFPKNDEEATEELDGRLRTAVRRLIRVRPRTATLMGSGLDSSLIAAYVKMTTGQAQALTLKMPWPPDESPAAAAIAHGIGVSHNICQPRLCDLDLLRELDGFVQVMEEPTSFGLGLFMMKLARDARALADGFFCGVSADALFGNPTSNPDDGDRDSIFHYIYREMSPENVGLVVKLDPPDPRRVVQHLRTQLASDLRYQARRLPFFLETGLMIRFAARLARFHDAEALFPYLDRDVVGFGIQLPPHLHGSGKPLLRRLAARYFTTGLPHDRKVPFTAYPISRLMEAGLLDPVLDFLDEKRTRERGLYRHRNLRRLIERYRVRTPEPGWHIIVWQLTMFELFCRRFVDNRPSVPLLSTHHLGRLGPFHPPVIETPLT